MLLSFSHLLTYTFAFIHPTLINGSTLSHISANYNQYKYTLTDVFLMNYTAVALAGQFVDKRSQSSCRLVTRNQTVCGMVNLPTLIFFIKSCRGIIYPKIKHFDKLTIQTIQSVSWPVHGLTGHKLVCERRCCQCCHVPNESKLHSTHEYAEHMDNVEWRQCIKKYSNFWTSQTNPSW